MKRLILAALLVLLAASPALAAVIHIPGCDVEDFNVVAGPGPKGKVEFEQGNTDFTGNVLVMNAASGLAWVGPHNRIHGTVIGKTVRVGTGAVVDRCIGDTIEGAGTCTEIVPGGFAALPNACKQIFPFPPTIVDLCVNVALAVNVPENQTETLPPGCYGIVRVGKKATLNLEPGLYFIRNLRVVIGGALVGAGSGQTFVRVRDNVILGPLTQITGLSVFTAATVGEGLTIDGGAKLTDVLAVIPGGSMHVHTGSQLSGSALAAGARVAIEPVLFSAPPPPPPIVCECPQGSHFAVQDCAPDTTCEQARLCLPD